MTADPWMSESDVGKGARWRSEIEQTLEASLAGVIVLTPDNLKSPWLLFEAGALSKKSQRVYTYLFGLEKNQAHEPLSQFQSTSANREDTLIMLKSINLVLGDAGVEEDRMVKAFEQNWTEFEAALNAVPASAAAAPLPPSAEEMMQEALAYLREQSHVLDELKGAMMFTFPPAFSSVPPPGRMNTGVVFGRYQSRGSLAGNAAELYGSPSGPPPSDPPKP
jgi:hypothetical protein